MQLSGAGRSSDGYLDSGLGKIETIAMFSKGPGGGGISTPNATQCTVCSKTNHTKDNCWFVVGFATKYNKVKNQGEDKMKKKSQLSGKMDE